MLAVWGRHHGGLVSKRFGDFRLHAKSSLKTRAGTGGKEGGVF